MWMLLILIFWVLVFARLAAIPRRDSSVPSVTTVSVLVCGAGCGWLLHGDSQRKAGQTQVLDIGRSQVSSFTRRKEIA